MNYFTNLSLVLLFIQIINPLEYNDDDEENQISAHLSK
jgi:hypothetical protein